MRVPPFRLPSAPPARLALAGIALALPASAATGPVSPVAEPPTAAAPASPQAPAATAREPAGGDTPRAVAALHEIVALQKSTLATARQSEAPSDLENLRPRLQKVVDGYETLLKNHPDFAAGWAAYGLYLCDPAVEERRQAMALLLRANALDPDLPVVKNQIGVLLAEDGRAIDALNYFLAASDLAPTEALYHFQIGLVLDEGRDQFLKTRAWTRATLDSTMLSAFARAVALAPDRTELAQRLSALEAAGAPAGDSSSLQ